MSTMVFLNCARGRAEVDKELYATVSSIPGVLRAVNGPVSINDKLHCMVVSVDGNDEKMRQTLEKLRSLPGIGSVTPYDAGLAPIL